MKTSNVLWIVVGVVLVVSLLCVRYLSSVQDFMAANVMWNGISTFSKESGAQRITALAQLHDIPESATLIEIPYLEYTDEELTIIREFAGNGGRLLILDDFGFGNQVLSGLGIEGRFAGQPLLDPLFCYRNQALPRVAGFAETAPGVEQLILNHATVLTGIPEDAVIASSSESSFIDADRNSSKGESESTGPFAVAARFAFGEGSVVLLSDPSVLINSMLNREDNYAFLLSLAGQAGGPLFLDVSHLAETPLDTTKVQLTEIERLVGNEYVLMGLTVATVFLVGRNIIAKGA